MWFREDISPLSDEQMSDLLPLLTCRALAVPVHERRRNLPGDRQKALDIMLPLVDAEEQVASDIYCLVGRIYKDMFLESHFTDTQSRDNGTQW